VQPLFITSGDLIADRRYDAARHYWLRGDLTAAADIMAQAVEAAPRFASAWFALGEIREELGDRDGAIEAFRQARAADADDRHGAGPHLMRLGAEPMAAMPPAYVRTLFDQYAPEFDRALLETLHYRGPRVLRDAMLGALHASGRWPAFRRAIDLGCGTGLGARAFDRYVNEMIGFDLSPGMIDKARATGLYNRLAIGDMVELLREEGESGADLVFAADALVYLPDLMPLFCEVRRVLDGRQGLFAFTVETHGSDGVTLGAGLRYQHGKAYIGDSLADAGFRLLALSEVSTRDEGHQPVPGLVAIAAPAAVRSVGAS
jgi:predicted TPR repeat methyltransferase